jgi:hypothetical protein
VNKKERGAAVKNYPHLCVSGRNRNESMMKKAPARVSDKQQMQAPYMGEIKKHRFERWKVTTIGGGGLCNRNGAEDWRKKKTMPLQICKTSSCDCEP